MRRLRLSYHNRFSIHHFLSNVLPVSEMTKELPAGTGILLATAPVDVTPTLLSRTSSVRFTELFVLLENVPPIKYSWLLQVRYMQSSVQGILPSD